MAEYLIKGETLTGIAEAIRVKTGGADPIAVTDMAAQIESITGGGSGGGGGGMLPAGLYFQPLSMRKPNDYSQAWCYLNGVRYVFSDAATGSGSLANVYKMDDVANTQTQVVSNTASALGMANAGVLCYVEFNGKIHICGGESKKHFAFDGTSLTAFAEMPNYVSNQPMFVHDNKLKVYSYSTGAVYVWDEETDTWAEEATVLSKYSGINAYVVNGVPYFFVSTKVYTYNGSTLTQVGTCKSNSVIGCAIGDCIYYWAFAQNGMPYSVFKYDTKTNQETEIGAIAPGYNGFSRFWDYNGQLAFLSSDNTARYAVTNMLVHHIEATE